MKLFIIASVIAVASAARLEHLERGYLPPDNNYGSQGGLQAQSRFGGQNSNQNSFGAQSTGFGGQDSGFGGQDSGFGGQSSFGSQGGFGARSGASAFRSGASLSEKQLKQYLPPDHEHSADSHGAQGNFGSFGRSSIQRNQYQGQGQNQYNIPSTQYGVPESNNQFGSSGASAFGGQRASLQGQGQGLTRQYLGPKSTNNFQNIPQQAFDDETGYHY